MDGIDRDTFLEVLVGSHRDVEKAENKFIILGPVLGIVVTIIIFSLSDIFIPEGHYSIWLVLVAVCLCLLAYLRLIYVVIVRDTKERIRRSVEKEVDIFFSQERKSKIISPVFPLFDSWSQVHLNKEKCTCSEAGSRTCTEHQSATPGFVLSGDMMRIIDKALYGEIGQGNLSEEEELAYYVRKYNDAQIMTLYEWDRGICEHYPSTPMQRRVCRHCQKELHEYVCRIALNRTTHTLFDLPKT